MFTMPHHHYFDFLHLCWVLLPHHWRHTWNSGRGRGVKSITARNHKGDATMVGGDNEWSWGVIERVVVERIQKLPRISTPNTLPSHQTQCCNQSTLE